MSNSNPRETPKCRLCGNEWWLRVFKLDYYDHGEEGKWASVVEAARDTKNPRYQCAKCGAVLDVDYETGSITYHLETRHGNIDVDELVNKAAEAVQHRLATVPPPWPPRY